MIKKRLFKYGSVFMCAAMLACSLGVYGITSNSNTTETQDVTVAQVSAGNDSESIISNAISSQLANATKATSSTTNSKEETVYVFANAKGAQDHVLVNEKLKNVTGLSSISDVSKLKNIVNVSGDETSSTGSNNALTWNASGNSITYQGTTTEKAPITMKITYLLDGKEITPENLAGKSGKVTIRYEYTNNEKKTVTVNGKSYSVAVPFTMMTGMVLPSDKFSNIEVTNGKISELSDSNVVLGITMPGLKDTLSLKFDSETLDMDIPEYFEVTADVTDFELDMSMSVATSNLLSDANVDDLSIDSLKDKMNQLQDAADHLTDGTVTLQDGTQTLADKAPELKDGTSQLANGLTELNDKVPSLTDGVAQLDGGATQLQGGSAQLNEGLNALSDTFKNEVVPGLNKLETGATELNGGMTKLQTLLIGAFDQIEENANKYTTKYNNLMTLGNQLETLASTPMAYFSVEGVGSISSINDAVGVLTNKNGIKDWTITPKTDMGTQISLADENTVAALYKKYMTEYSTILGMKVKDATVAGAGGNPSTDPTSYTSLFGDVNKVIAAQGIEGISAIEDVYNKELQMLLSAASNGNVSTALNQVYAQAMYETTKEGAVVTGENGKPKDSELVTGLEALVDGSADLKDGITTLKEGIGSFDVLEPKTETACSALYKLRAGSSQLKDGTNTLKAGTTQLSEGASTLAGGAAQLSDGATKLDSAAATLSDGVTELNNGAITLKDGMAEFNETGIKSLTSLVGTDADTAIDTLKAVVKAGQEYQSFGGKSDDMEGSVTFIYKTDGITK